MQDYIITKEHLEQFGIAVNESELPSLLEHINETLEERVGTAIAESLSDEDIETLSTMQESATDEEIANWITQHVPDVAAITQDEVDILLGEIANKHKDFDS